MDFSHDGRYLAIAGQEAGIEVWDLNRIREGLVDLGLDLDQPPFPTVEPETDLPPLKVELDPRVILSFIVLPQPRLSEQVFQEAVREGGKHR